eukprot:GHRQ01027412.1.p2 GENE.GHRQ01027412.1~~GHRQ01027412.1.p2  ORF type:complete len:140 (-),score=25.05 GHRQ01027412.1:55-474(-)
MSCAWRHLSCLACCIRLGHGCCYWQDALHRKITLTCTTSRHRLAQQRVTSGYVQLTYSCCVADCPAADTHTALDPAACSKHNFKYKPRAGDALLVYSLNPDSSVDAHAALASCPVAKGTQWVVTKWLHNWSPQVTSPAN